MADAKRRFLFPDQLQQFEDSVRVICVRVRDNNGIKSGNAALFQIWENPFSPIADALLLPPSFSITKRPLSTTSESPWPTSSAVMENVSRGR